MGETQRKLYLAELRRSREQVMQTVAEKGLNKSKIHVLAALTPAAVLIFRYNNPDALLTLLLTAAAYAFVRSLDGGRLRWVTLPSVSPVILFAVILGVIQGLQYFTQALVASSVAAGSVQGGDNPQTIGYPEDSTLFYPVLLYQHGFRFFHMGYASAMAMLLLAISFVVTLIIVRNSRRWVHYAATAR